MYGKNVGLTSSDVERSRSIHGANVFKKEKKKGFFRRFFENLNDPIIKILVIALAVEVIFTFGHCNFFEVGGIIIAILIATTVSTLSEYGSERAFEEMQSESSECKVRALRDGVVSEISLSEVVVGDIVLLSAGDRIAADGIILEGKISVDQSALNGEGKEISKYPSRNTGEVSLSSRGYVFGGTVITLGNAVMRVERVGENTYYGMVAKDVQAETRVSPLKLRLSALAAQISKIGYVMAGAVALFYLFNAFVVENGFESARIIASLKDFRGVFSTLVHALTLMITVIVVAVPEGLPMMITVVLSANMKKMFRDNVLVKKLVGIETAGSLNILFTDKTGTVTVGEPKCERIVCSDAAYKSMVALRKSGEIHRILSLCAIYNTDSALNGDAVIGGNGTDRAITEYFKSEKYPALKIKSKESFSSEKKSSSVTLEDGMTIIKGAPEKIIAGCKFALNSHGIIESIDKKSIEEKLFESASVGSRVVAVAFKPADKNDFVFAALIVLRDILRRDTKRAISEMRSAGVQIVMLTGDGRETAVAVALECGIMSGNSDEVVLTSAELASLDDEEVKKLIPSLRVLARALPQDKTRLVRLSQELNLVVGMTGDGVNDAPSLKLSDVGFAMGSGTDIAKGAGDVIILNNSMFAINRTILYGRTIFKSIRKFITFQLIMNFAACGISLLGQILGVETPITIVQMLWVNIIMDTLGGLAFAGEPALPYYMKEKPKRRDESILTGKMIKRIVVMGSYSLVLCTAFLKAEGIKAIFRGANSELRFLTAFYALFIFLGIFNSFCARSERMWVLSNISKNKPFVVIMILISVIQVLMIYFGGELFRSSPLSSKELYMVIMLALSVIPFDFIYRIFEKLGGKG